MATAEAYAWEQPVGAALLDAAGGGWPHLARNAAVAFIAEAEDTPASLGVRLIADVRAAFGDKSQMATADLLTTLNSMEEAPWGDMRGRPLDSRRLARMLHPYGVRSCKLRLGATTANGYRREDLWDAWQRYLPPSSPECGTNGTASRLAPERSDSLVPDVPDVPDFQGHEGPAACPRCDGADPACPWCAEGGRAARSRNRDFRS